jgi:hypothetical protein
MNVTWTKTKKYMGVDEPPVNCLDGVIGKLKVCRIMPKNEEDPYDDNHMLLNANKFSCFTGSQDECKQKFLELISEAKEITWKEFERPKKYFKGYYKRKTIDGSLGNFKICSIEDKYKSDKYRLHNVNGFELGRTRQPLESCKRLAQNLLEGK